MLGRALYGCTIIIILIGLSRNYKWFILGDIMGKIVPEDYDFEAHKKLVPMQPGDVPVTYADTSALEEDFGFRPSTSLREGLRKFAEWYKEFYQI